MRSAKPRPHFVLAPVLRAVGIVLIACATAFPFDATATSQEQTLDADAYFAAIVKVHARALPDARSAATLGSEREGTGIVIEKGGLTLTIISIVTGHMARAQIKRTGEEGGTLALIGLIISYLHIAVTVLVVIFLFGLVVAFLTFIFHALATGG